MGAVWLPDLPDVIAAAGIPVNVWPGWETRSNAKGGYDAIYGICVHHTASNASAVNDMSYMWDNAPLRPIGAIYLARDGMVTVGAAGQTNCQGLGGPRLTSRGPIPLDQGNRYAIAIEAANTGTGEVWPQAQQDTYVQLCAALVKAYGLQPSDVFAHHEWTTRKIDPWGPSRYAGTAKWDMDLFREDIAMALAPPPPRPEVQPPTPDTEIDMIYIDWRKNTPHHTGLIATGTHLAWSFDGNAAGVYIKAGAKVVNVDDVELLALIKSSETTTACPPNLLPDMKLAWNV